MLFPSRLRLHSERACLQLGGEALKCGGGEALPRKTDARAIRSKQRWRSSLVCTVTRHEPSIPVRPSVGDLQLTSCFPTQHTLSNGHAGASDRLQMSH